MHNPTVNLWQKVSERENENVKVEVLNPIINKGMIEREGKRK